MDKLSDADVQDRLGHLPEWTEVGGEIQRTYKFADFKASMRFVNEVADQAEHVQHHPDILIRYNKVTLTLSTHDAGGITVKDFDMARFADQVADTVVSAGAG